MDGRRNVGHIQRDKYRKLNRQPDRIRISNGNPANNLSGLTATD